MGFFSNNKYDNIYSLKKYVNKKLIIFIVAMVIIALIMLFAVVSNIINMQIRVKRATEFELQIMEYVKIQEEEKKKKEEERLAKIPQLTDEGKENLSNIYEGDAKVAYLTFDDGPSINTKDILDILKANEIKATFFALGVQVKEFPETTKRIYDEGHYIANHGYSHIYSKIYQSPETVIEEFNQCNQEIVNAIGVPEYNSHLFRFPGGFVGGKYQAVKNATLPLLEQNNILYVDWNALTGDSEKVNPDEAYLMGTLERTIQGKNKIVVLMHDAYAKRITVDVLQRVIDYLKEQGYEFDNFYNIIK